MASLKDQHNLSLQPPAELERLGQIAEHFGIKQSDDLSAVVEAIRITIKRISPTITSWSNLISETDPDNIDTFIKLALAGQNIIDTRNELRDIASILLEAGYQPQDQRTKQQLQQIFATNRDIDETPQTPAEMLTTFNWQLLEVSEISERSSMRTRLKRNQATFKEALQEQQRIVMTALSRVLINYIQNKGQLSPEMKNQLRSIVDKAETVYKTQQRYGTREAPPIMMDRLNAA